MVPSSKSGGEHEDSGFGGVEISNEGIDSLELEAWINENIVFARGFAGFSPEFECTSDSGADGNDAMSLRLCLLDGFEGFVRNMEPFGMHVVFFDVVAADRKESAESNMEGEIFYLDTFLLKFLNKTFSHVEAGGWCGGRTEFFGPDRLIAFDVFGVGVAMEVGWERDIAVVGNNFGEVATSGDGSGAVAEDFFNGDDVRGFFVVGDVFDSKLIASMKFAAIHDMVDVAVMFFEDDKFARATVGKLCEDAGAHDASIIQNNEITRFEKIGEVGVL